MKTIDIVVAVCNEEDLVRPFLDSLRQLYLPADIALGIIFVEDSSTDRTRVVLREVCKNDASVRFYSLERGYGQAPALWFGMQQSNADAVITMDVDQGHPVTLIPSMVDAWLNGADIVQGVRMDISGRPVYRDLGTRAFDVLVRIVTGIDLRQQNVHYRLITKTVKKDFLKNSSWIYFLRFNFPDNRYRVQRIEFTSQERTVGYSKFGFRKLLVHSLRGILSIVPAVRFWLIMVLSVFAAVLLSVLLHWIIGFIFVTLAMFVIVTYWHMRNNNIFHCMKVVEQSGRK